MYTTIHAKILNRRGYTWQRMLAIGVKQGCPHSSILFDLYIDEPGTYLDETG